MPARPRTARRWWSGLAGTGAAAGDTLTVNWGSQTVTYTLLAADISAGSATVTVPLATIAAQGQGTFDVTARLTDAAGNAGANSAATSVTVDAVAPTATVAITAIADDNGTSSSDYVTSDTTLTVSGTHGALGSGETVQVSSDGGASWADATSTASTWSYTDPATHGTSFTYQVRIVDAVGNVDANTASQAVTIDTAAPTAPSITSIPENAGGGINTIEASNGTPVVVGLAGTGAAAGDTLTVTWGGQTVTYTLLAGRHLGQQRDGDGAPGDDHGARQRHVRRDGPADRCSGQCRRQLDGDPGNGRHAGADGRNHGHNHRQRHVVERLCHQRHDADGVGHARPVPLRRDGAGQQRRWHHLGRCHQHAGRLELYRSDAARTSFTYQVRIVDSANNIGSTDSQAVTIDTVAPTAPSITSIAENGGGGINTGEASDGTPVVVGLAGTGAAAGDTLTVNWGSQTVTYTLLAADISASSATVTVPAATISAQGQGTFDVTARLTDTAGNAGANSSAFPVTVDTAAPTATVAITAIANDNGASSSDYVTSDTTLTVSGTHGALGSGETVQVSSDGGASWADVTTSTASTWSYTDPTPHATSFTYQVRIVDAVGNVGANTASQAVTIDTAAPTAPSITSIAESGGGINAGEASDGTPVVVGLAGTGAAAGDTLTVNWGGQTVTYTLLAADISASSATVTVPAATISAQGQGTFDVTARLTDAAGNVGATSGAFPVTVDAAAPTATVAITAITTDSGTSSSDYVTSDTTLTVSGTHDPLGSGEKVQVSSDGGASWADVTSTASTWSYTDPDAAWHELHLPGADRRRRGQCRRQHRQPGGDGRHGGAGGAVDHLDPGKQRRHQRHRGLERHAGGGRAWRAPGRRRATR